MTTTANDHLSTLSEQQAYLHALRTSGKLPSDQPRPSFGALEHTINLIEDVARRSNGNIRAIDRTIVALAGKNTALAALVEDKFSLPAMVEVLRNETLIPPLPGGVVFSPEASRGACPCRDDYINYSRLVSPEGYEGFHDGCFWWLLSTIAARRVYTDFTERQYTPLYIILAARPGMYSKTTTAMVAKKVLKALGLEWLLGSSRTTPQKLLSDMAGMPPADYSELRFEDQEYLKLRLAMSGQRGWYYDEFGKFVKAMLKQNGAMADFAELLLVMDACEDMFDTSTLTRGREVIDRPYLALLGNTTPASIKTHAKAGAEFWGDGFWARMAFVCPPPDTALDSPFTRGEKPVPSSLIQPLLEWHERLGMPTIEIEPIRDENGKETGRYRKEWIQPLRETGYSLPDEVYDAWARYRSALKQIAKRFRNEDLDPSYERLPVKAMRLATLVASLQNSSQIEMRHWALAQEVAERWRGSLHELYAQINSVEVSDSATIEEKVIEYVEKLQSKAPPTARDIARSLHKDTLSIEPVLCGLARAGVLEKIPGRQSVRYKIAGGI